MTDDSKRPPPDDGAPFDPESTAPSSPDDATIPSAPDDATLTSGGPSAPPDQERPGTMIGPYRLVRPLGEGGFGTVYLAEQQEPIQRRVALKVIKLGMDTREVIARFEAEKQALALMDHPGIAKVFDAGATATGRPYFVMELVEGVPVTEYCDRHTMGTRERLDLFREICGAVQHAHQKGVIHRDIKPSNVLVTEVAGKPVPKVIDFGIAKATDARLTEKTLFTQESQFIGTPAYMSPEQTGLAGLDVDTRSDIYSLGVLLYEMLTGVTPFDDASLRSAGFAEIQRIIREDDPPRPSTRASRLGERLDATAAHRRLRAQQLVKRLRGELDWVVMKCLEKDRARRYETANGLARDIERFLADEPVSASPPSRTYRLRKLVVRNRAVFAAGAVMVLLLAAGVVGTSIGLVRARQAEQVALTEAAKSDQVAVFLKDMLAGVGPSAARGRDTEMLEEILAETDAKIGEELAGQPEVEGEIRSHLGQTYFDLGRLEQAEEQFDRARELLIEAHGERNGDVARQYSNLGLVHEALQEFPESEAAHRKALELRRELYPDGHEDLAMNLVNLANMYVNDSRYEEAEPLLLEGLAELRKVRGDEHEDVAICLNSLGNLMQHLRRYDEAEPFYEQALAIHTATLGEDHPYTITDLANMGWLALNTEKNERAAELFARAAELSRRVYAEANPKLIHAINAQARAARVLGRYAAADSLYRECVTLAEEVFGPDHASTADELLARADCLSDMGRFEEADALSERAIAIHEKTFGPENPTTLRSRYIYAYSVYSRDEYGKAIPLLERSLKDYLAAAGHDHDHTALVLNSLGRALRDDGRLAEAADRLLEARDIRERVLGPDHLLTGVSDHDLGECRFLQGRLDEAADRIASAIAIYSAKLDGTHRVFGTIRYLLARVDLERGQPAETLALVAAGRPITVAARGEDHEELVVCDALEGLARAQLGEAEAAAALADRAEARLSELSGRRLALIQLDLGRIRALAGDHGAAERLLLASHATCDEAFGAKHSLTRRAVEALIANYDAWAAAGSDDAAAAAREWKARRAAARG